MEAFRTRTPGAGTPQGAVISPLPVNLYLNPLDHLMDQSGGEMVRYADDFVMLCRSREQAESALEAVRAWMEEAGLTLQPDKTRVVSMDENGGSFEFLGYRFAREKKPGLPVPASQEHEEAPGNAAPSDPPVQRQQP